MVKLFVEKRKIKHTPVPLKKGVVRKINVIHNYDPAEYYQKLLK
jgi:hypothetical protein